MFAYFFHTIASIEDNRGQENVKEDLRIEAGLLLVVFELLLLAAPRYLVLVDERLRLRHIAHAQIQILGQIFKLYVGPRDCQRFLVGRFKTIPKYDTKYCTYF